jgi:hypothetical protein
MSKRFADQFSKNLGKSRKPKSRQAYEALRNIADGIQVTLSKGRAGKLKVGLEPGYVTNLGQQLRLRLSIPARKWEETLLRAYIPPDGFPVNLDLGEEEPVPCRNTAELEEAVLKFLKKPEIDSRLTIVRESL